MLKVDGCGTAPTYEFTNQTNVAAMFSSDGEKGDGSILCGCQLLKGDEPTPFAVDTELVQQVIQEYSSDAVRLVGMLTVLVACAMAAM